LAACVVACLALAGAQATGAATRTRVPRDCVHEAFKPRKIVIACGDGNLFLSGMRWSSWSSTVARGSGTANANDCTPNCAAGHFHTYPARVKLSRPGTCPHHGRQFMTLTITYPHAAPTRLHHYSTPIVCP